MLKNVILFLSLLLTSCSTPTKTSSHSMRVPADEGFYTLPAQREGYDTATINKVKRSVGQLFVEKKAKYTKQEIEKRRATRCGSEEGMYWLGSLCAQLNDKKCDGGCEVEDFFPSCSGGKVGSLFVTAKHCIPEGPKRMLAKFVGEDGSLVEVPLQANKLTVHTLPHDISALQLQSGSLFDKIPSVEIDSHMNNGEPVFGIGFPYVDNSIRTQKNSDYDHVTAGMRITFGKIVEANPKKWAYCVYSNDIDKADPEKWILEESCASVDYSKYTYGAREERNILLADTDMIYGMSGSFLFSADGKVLGIGSTVKTSMPGNYSSSKPAVYSKAENLDRILRAFP